MMPVSFLYLCIVGDSERPENAKSEFEDYYSLELSMCLCMLLLIMFLLTTELLKRNSWFGSSIEKRKLVCLAAPDSDPEAFSVITITCYSTKKLALG